MTMRTAAPVLALALVATVPASAGEADAEGRLRIKSETVMCLRAPCPRIGVLAAIAADGRPLFAGSAPPRMTGAAADVAAATDAWRTGACLMLEGRYRGAPRRLEIRRILGTC